MDRTADNSSTDIECLWCKKTAKYISKRKGYVEPQIFKIYYCESCNTSFSMPRVNPDRIYELIYENVKSIGGYSRYYNYQKSVLRKKNPLKYLSSSEPSYWGPINAIKEVLKLDKSAKILEVGSGLGYLTYSLKRDGYNVHGLDISSEAVQKACEIYGDYYICDDLHMYAKNHPEKYDLVVMTEVIEHLNEPQKFIDSIKELLKPQGACVFTTPNKSFYSKNNAWMTDAPPVHCWWFSEDSINFLAAKNNMDVKFIDFSKYYRQHPQIYSSFEPDYEGDFVFDRNENIIYPYEAKKNNILSVIKRTYLYKLMRNQLILAKYPNKFIKGGVRANVMCSVLIKK